MLPEGHLLNLDVEIIITKDGIYPEGVPTYGSDMAAGFDVRAAIDAPITLNPGHKAILIPTGVKIHINNPQFVAVMVPRSGLGHKQGLVLGNGTGIIDADYQGEISVSAVNRRRGIEHDGSGGNPENTPPIIINPGDRIAQILLMPVTRANFKAVTQFTGDSNRGNAGFGSTGVQ